MNRTSMQAGESFPTAQDLDRALEIAALSLVVSSPGQLSDLLAQLQRLVPCECAAACLKPVDGNGRWGSTLGSVVCDFPQTLFEFDGIDTPALLANALHFDRFKPGSVAWGDALARLGADQAARLLVATREAGLVDGLTLWTTSAHKPVGSVFSFSGPPALHSPRARRLLHLLVPHLHAALERLTGSQSVGRALLTVRELEVLGWMRHGKSHWEIGQLLGISERTAKFHAANLIAKLGVTSKAQAVSLASEQGWFS